MQLKHVLPLLILCLGSLGQLQAQAAIFALIFGDKVASENFNIGLEIGFNHHNFANMPAGASAGGINFGMAGNIRLNENWSLHPNVFFLGQRNAQLDAFSLNSSNAALNQDFEGVPTDIQARFIDIPVFINYRFSNSNFKIGLAPQVSFRTESRFVFKNKQGEFKYSEAALTANMEYGVIGQIGYILGADKESKEIHVQLRYYQGFTDLFEEALITGENTSSYFAIALSFPFVKKEE